MGLPLHVARLRFILHVGFAFLSLVSLCMIVCLFLVRLCMRLPFACCKAAFYSARV